MKAVHGVMKDPAAAAALPVQKMALTMRRRERGNDHIETLVAMGNLTVTHQNMGDYAAALPLLQEALEATIVSMGNLAVVLANMRKPDLSLRLRKEASEICRRVFGGQHPQTHQAAGNCGVLLFKMGDKAAAAPLLREAVQGLTAVYSTEHRLVRHFQEFLNRLVERRRRHQQLMLGTLR